MCSGNTPHGIENAMSSEPRLRMRNISKSFGGVHALRDVTVEAHAGEVHALCGENGAGKSTLMKLHDGAITEYTGEYLEIVPNRRLIFSLCVPTQHVITRTLVEISPSRKGCSLTLTHEHVPRCCIQRTRSRWTRILSVPVVSLASNCICLAGHTARPFPLARSRHTRIQRRTRGRVGTVTCNYFVRDPYGAKQQPDSGSARG